MRFQGSTAAARRAIGRLCRQRRVGVPMLGALIGGALIALPLPPAALANGANATEPTSATPEPVPNATRQRFLADAKAFDAAMGKSDCAAALPPARGLLANPLFDDLPNDTKLAIWTDAASCAAQKDHPEEAFDDARHATQLPNAGDWVWTYRIWEAVDLDRPDDVAEAIEALGAAHAAPLNAVPVRAFYEFQRKQTDAGHTEALRRVLTALEKADYKPKATGESADGLWLNAARLAVDAGEPDHAAALTRRITGAGQLMRLKLDARFAAVVAADPARFDLKAAAERELAEDRAVAAAHPELLEPVQELLSDLRALGRFDEALALAQATLDRAAHAPKSKPAFTDQAGQLNWIVDSKAYLLLELGRVDEAVTTERAAARLSEDGQSVNVSQTINLAGFLNDANRPAEALATLAHVDKNVSPYGLAWVHAERACAEQAVGGQVAAGVAAELAYLAAHQADNPGARLKAQLCAGDLDAAAATLIKDLGDPKQRYDTLVYLCVFDGGPARRTNAAVADRLATVAARPDVRAAVAKVGHTEHIPLNGDTFIDLF